MVELDDRQTCLCWLSKHGGPPNVLSVTCLISVSASGSRLTMQLPSASYSTLPRNLTSSRVSGLGLRRDLPTYWRSPPTPSHLTLSRRSCSALFRGTLQCLSLVMCHTLTSVKVHPHHNFCIPIWIINRPIFILAENFKICVMWVDIRLLKFPLCNTWHIM